MAELAYLQVTRVCDQKCVFCSNPANGRVVSWGEAAGMMDGFARAGAAGVILTGGEPMMRADIYDIAKHGTKLGLRMVMAPCGLLVTEELAQKMKDSGIMRVSLSIDGLDAGSHNAFRRVEGAFEGVMKDFTLYWDYIRPGGIFAGHDWNLPTVQQAVKTFFPDHSKVVPVSNEGWYIIK